MARTLATRARRHERGATLVELALMLPVLLIVSLGTVELGRAWVASNEVDGATSQAARMGAAAGGRVEADRDILISLRAALPEDELAVVDRVVIFRSATPDGAVPAGCIKPVGSVSEIGTPDCNTYTGDTLRTTTASSMVGFGANAEAKDRFWPPASRRDTLVESPDYIGVWVRTAFDTLTGVVVDEVALVEVTVHRIQPDLFG